MNDERTKQQLCPVLEFVSKNLPVRNWFLALLDEDSLQDMYFAVLYARDDIDKFMEKTKSTLWGYVNEEKAPILKTMRIFYVLSLVDLGTAV